jgi:lipoyl(octanoyl) transferase
LRVLRYDLLDYEQSEQLQTRLVEERKQDRIPNTLVLLEHPAVLTLGRTASLEHLKVSLAELPIPLIRTGRGGQVTYHGPGQLVAYPILRLPEGARDLHRYLRDLEQIAIEVAAEFKVVASREPGRTGAWVNGRKLASIGVRASSWVTSHGLSLNYGLDLSGFDLIEPCGLKGVQMTSLGLELGAAPDRASVETSCVRHFAALFS